MSFWSRLFKSSQAESQENQALVLAQQGQDQEWEPLAKYVTANEEDRQLLSVIATAIAAGDKPDSEFSVKSVSIRNPEYQTIALIAAAISAGDKTDVHLRVKNIYQKKV
ncbi:TPA: hypothetical protein ACGO1T_000399 [Streptococcus suis]